MPRGIRNKNPGNIDRTGILWQGMALTQTDPRFCVFTDMFWGIRALGKCLLTDEDEHDLHTVRQIIDRWAPPTENQTTIYVQDVAKDMGVGTDDQVNLHDHANLCSMIEAISRHENGGDFLVSADVTKGASLALT